MLVAFWSRQKEEGRIDLESVEMRIRSSMHDIGRGMLEQLLNADCSPGRPPCCEKGRTFEFVGYREKKILTVLGEVKIRRDYYYDKDCGEGMFPKDKALLIEKTSLSPGAKRMAGRVGAMRPFGLGEEDLKELAGITVSAKEIERVSHKLGEEVEEFLTKEEACNIKDKTIPT